MSHSAKAEEFMSFALILASNIVTPRTGLFLVLLSCQPRVTVKSRFVYKVLMDLYSTEHLCIYPFRNTSDISIRVSSSEVYTIAVYLAIGNKIYVTVTFGWHYSRLLFRA